MLTLESAEAKVAQMYKRLGERRAEYERLNNYFQGDQPLAFASSNFREFHAGRYSKFADNWCGVVASSPAERIRVDGFRIGDDAQNQSPEEAELWRDWKINDMDAQSSQGFLSSIVAKRSAILVWGTPDNEPVVTWERADQVIVEHDPSGRVRRYGFKAWTDDDAKREYATLYTPDQVWKFERRKTSLTLPSGVGSGAWLQRSVDGEPWPMVNPFGIVPLVEVPNRPVLGGEALSDIDGTVSMQNAINLLWAYLFNAADFASMPARVVMGQEPPKIPILDENGQKVGEQPVDIKHLQQGRMLWLTGQNTSVDQWEAAKLDVFTEVINIAVRHVAAQTRTPLHYVVGELNNINGDTLNAMEGGLVNKVEEFQLFASLPVRETFRLMAMVRGNDAVAEACRLGDVVWKSPLTRSEAQLADALLKKRDIGYPLQALFEMDGRSQAEITRLMAMREAEADDPTMARLLREVRTTPSIDADRVA